MAGVRGGDYGANAGLILRTGRIQGLTKPATTFLVNWRSVLDISVPTTKMSQNVSKWRIWSRLTTLHAGSLKVPSSLSNKKRIWRLVIPVALLVFVLGATVGEASHHHASFSSGACPICHVSHLAIEPPVASTRRALLVPSGPGPELQSCSFTPRLAARYIAARAPPA